MYSALKQVTPALVTATEEVWREQLNAAKGNLLPSRYLQALDWACRHADNKNDEGSFVYAMLRGGERAACALVEITHAMAGKKDAWLKVLRIHVEPRLDLGSDGVSPKELVEVASQVLTKALKLTIDEHPAGELKVWGDSPLTTEFLEATCGFLSESKNLRVSTKGNWLCISRIA